MQKALPVTPSIAEELKGKIEELFPGSQDPSISKIFEKIEKLENELNHLNKIEMPFRLLVQAVKDYAIYALTTEGLVSTWNMGAQRIKGYDSSEIIGQHFSIFYPQEAIDTKFPQLELEIAAVAGRFEDTGIRVRKDGSHFWANVIITAIFDPSGKLTGFVKVTRDITERKEAELALQQSNEELEVRVEERTRQLKEREIEIQEARRSAEIANEAKSAFLANMSHEIRTPLGAILGFSEFLANDDISKAQKESAIDAIQRNGKLLTNLIADILDLSKVEAGKLTLEKRPICLKETLNDILSTLSLVSAAKGIELRLVNEVPFDIIESDLVRLRQILLNIVGNAVKFTAKGYVQILARFDAEKSKIEFQVSDTGRGISAQQAKKLFFSFSQGDDSITRKYGGTGLGLVLSKRLSVALGGDLLLSKSEPEIGSTFIISIDPGNFKDLQAREKIVSSVRLTSEAANLKFMGKKILVVDDSKDNQVLIAFILEKYGSILERAENGQDALSKVSQFNPDMVLMDLQMPIMGGQEATLALRKGGYKRPIIALTAHAMKDEREHCLQMGFDDYVTKPIDRQKFIQTLQFFS